MPQLVRERRRMCFVLRGQHYALAAANKIPRQRAADVAGSDDCGSHRDSFSLRDGDGDRVRPEGYDNAVVTAWGA